MLRAAPDSLGPAPMRNAPLPVNAGPSDEHRADLGPPLTGRRLHPKAGHDQWRKRKDAPSITPAAKPSTMSVPRGPAGRRKRTASDAEAVAGPGEHSLRTTQANSGHGRFRSWVRPRVGAIEAITQGVHSRPS